MALESLCLVKPRRAPWRANALFRTSVEQLWWTIGTEESRMLCSFSGKTWSSRHASADYWCFRPVLNLASCLDPLPVVREKWPVDQVFHKGKGNICHTIWREHLKQKLLASTAVGRPIVQNLGWCSQRRVASPGQVPASLQKSKMLPFSSILHGTRSRFSTTSVCSRAQRIHLSKESV